METKQVTGRPKAVINWEEVGNYSALGATDEQISNMIGHDINTLKARCLDDNKMPFSQFIKKHKDGFVMSNRGVLKKQAEEGSTTAAIYLDKTVGKQMEEHQKQTIELKKEENNIEQTKVNRVLGDEPIE